LVVTYFFTDAAMWAHLGAVVEIFDNPSFSILLANFSLVCRLKFSRGNNF